MTTKLAGRLFCTVPEAAKVLELDPRTLRRAIASGDFPAVSVAGTWRVPVAKLLALAGLDDDAATLSPLGVLATPTVLDGATREHRAAS